MVRLAKSYDALSSEENPAEMFRRLVTVFCGGEAN